ncbi:hypothetical protein FHG87_012196 [Trinorchestia longiramus]|nr:hypothetical protein FHG87_012196 [Trinorchestia longiramus]
MGVGVMQTKNAVLLEQSAYTMALLSRFGMDKENSVATPVDVNADLVTTSDEVEDCDKDLYQSAVDYILHIAQCFGNPKVELRAEAGNPKLWWTCLKTKFAYLERSVFAATFTSLQHNLGNIPDS